MTKFQNEKLIMINFYFKITRLKKKKNHQVKFQCLVMYFRNKPRLVIKT